MFIFWTLAGVTFAILVLGAIAVILRHHFSGRSKVFPYRVLRNFAWSAVVLGIVAIVVAGYETQRFRSRAVSVEGSVVELERRSGEDGDTFAPRISFKNGSGAEYSFVTRSSSYPAEYEVGEKVSVLYLPDEPGSARLDAPLEVWGLPFALSILTVVCAAMAAYLHFRSARADRR